MVISKYPRNDGEYRQIRRQEHRERHFACFCRRVFTRIRCRCSNDARKYRHGARGLRRRSQFGDICQLGYVRRLAGKSTIQYIFFENNSKNTVGTMWAYPSFNLKFGLDPLELVSLEDNKKTIVELLHRKR